LGFLLHKRLNPLWDKSKIVCLSQLKNANSDRYSQVLSVLFQDFSVCFLDLYIDALQNLALHQIPFVSHRCISVHYWTD
jgi:hypothetical protein